MPAEIISINGGKIDDTRVPNQRIIEVLEGYLERARAGEITGLIVNAQSADETVMGSRTGTISYRMIGLLTQHTHELCAAMAAVECDLAE